MASKDRSILLITGGNAGLGLETVKSLYKSTPAKPYLLIIGSRTVSNAEEAIAGLKKKFPDAKHELQAIQVDVHSDSSIEQAFETVSARWGKLDTLINNAGADLSSKQNLSLRERWVNTYDVNVAGTYIMTHTFIPLLLKSSSPRILFITSGLSTLTNISNGSLPSRLHWPTPSPGWPKTTPFGSPAYMSSKTGLNMMAVWLSQVLKGDGVKVFIISPGFLATGLGGIGEEKLRSMGAKSPDVGAERIRTVVEGDRDADTGKVIFEDGTQDF